MEILQIIAGPLVAHFLAENFAMQIALAAPMDFGKILE
jgi:hypothetical protein